MNTSLQLAILHACPVLQLQLVAIAATTTENTEKITIDLSIVEQEQA